MPLWHFFESLVPKPQTRHHFQTNRGQLNEGVTAPANSTLFHSLFSISPMYFSVPNDFSPSSFCFGPTKFSNQLRSSRFYSTAETSSIMTFGFMFNSIQLREEEKKLNCDSVYIEVDFVAHFYWFILVNFITEILFWSLFACLAGLATLHYSSFICWFYGRNCCKYWNLRFGLIFYLFDVCIFFIFSYLRSDSSNHVVGCQCEFSFRMPMHSKRLMSRQTLQLNRQMRKGKDVHSFHFEAFTFEAKIFAAKETLFLLLNDE